jgi:hypothetical protein
MGGWVKAMAYIDPLPNGNGIRHCFNSQLAGSAATTPPCGLTFTALAAGYYTIDFGFRMTNRFVAVTSEGQGIAISACVDQNCLETAGTAAVVWATDVYSGNLYDVPFHIIVF